MYIQISAFLTDTSGFVANSFTWSDLESISSDSTESADEVAGVYQPDDKTDDNVDMSSTL